jgi:hypothetical protein
LRKGDAVISELPCQSPLKYYLFLQKVPFEYIYDYRVLQSRRLFVVINRPNRQTPDSVLEANQLKLQPNVRLEPVSDLGESAIYVYISIEVPKSPH